MHYKPIFLILAQNTVGPFLEMGVCQVFFKHIFLAAVTPLPRINVCQCLPNWALLALIFLATLPGKAGAFDACAPTSRSQTYLAISTMQVTTWMLEVVSEMEMVTGPSYLYYYNGERRASRAARLHLRPHSTLMAVSLTLFTAQMSGW